MNKKELSVLLADAGILKREKIKSDQVENYDKSDLYKKDGEIFHLEKTDLEQPDINTALLANIAINITTIKNICVAFVIIAIVSLILSLMAVMV